MTEPYPNPEIRFVLAVPFDTKVGIRGAIQRNVFMAVRLLI
jgi:hypothetical protein